MTALESWDITPTCRGNRGIDGAWDEAVGQLRQVYDAQLQRFGGAATLTLSISRKPAPGIPARVYAAASGASGDAQPEPEEQR
jgi:hypothetical protein